MKHTAPQTRPRTYTRARTHIRKHRYRHAHGERQVVPVRTSSTDHTTRHVFDSQPRLVYLPRSDAALLALEVGGGLRILSSSSSRRVERASSADAAEMLVVGSVVR